VTLAPHVLVDKACAPTALGVQSPADSGLFCASAQDHTLYVSARATPTQAIADAIAARVRTAARRDTAMTSQGRISTAGTPRRQARQMAAEQPAAEAVRQDVGVRRASGPRQPGDDVAESESTELARRVAEPRRGDGAEPRSGGGVGVQLRYARNPQ